MLLVRVYFSSRDTNPHQFCFTFWKVCFFIGTWNSGSTVPGDPYIAKWPDEHGNLKQRHVVHPSVISKYFNVSNIIDRGNHLRQGELMLEEHWITRDAWFRIITTILGVCVVDAYLIARHSCSSDAGIDKMGVKDWAMETAVDLLTRKMSEEPRVEIFGDISVSAPAGSSTRHEDGVEVQLTQGPKTLQDAILLHPIDRTSQRGKNDDIVRRKCQMNAAGCNPNGVRDECQHPVCKEKVKRSNNRFADQHGTFICSNQACRLKHWNDVFKLSTQ